MRLITTSQDIRIIPYNKHYYEQLVKIKKIVADYFDLEYEELHAKSKSPKYAYPRQVCYYIFNHFFPHDGNRMPSLALIGSLFNINKKGYDHATVIHGINLIKSDMFTYPQSKICIEKLIDKCEKEVRIYGENKENVKKIQLHKIINAIKRNMSINEKIEYNYVVSEMKKNAKYLNN